MTRLQEAIGLGLVLGIVHGLVQPGHSSAGSPELYSASMTTIRRQLLP